MYIFQLYKYISTILVWTMTLFLVIILYHYSTVYISWEPRTLARIDTWYNALRIFIVANIASSVVYTIFAYIRNIRLVEKRIIRRFLPIIRFLITMIIWVIAGFLILEAFHVNTRNILAGAGISGALIALASKDVITNLLGSLSILFSRTFDIGDVIRVRTLRITIEGLVEEITLNHTKITHKNGEVIYLPNQTIYTQAVENLSRRRFYTYEYIVPFAKTRTSDDVNFVLKIIEGKISTYYPIEIVYTMENQNARDYIYRIEVKLPEENAVFDREMRSFLINYIFVETTHIVDVPNDKNKEKEEHNAMLAATADSEE